ncbi:HemK2/MTQ2 family protein methyltransferase [Halomarina ordinaria]|uniref:HemK2/MTQ2 family protein methyltransferase n=1 Tax=Halomarina ordinaria TaxID=3033939 RepID=A0ABD5U8B9_9EURY|nr:HemK2/MTQ2 family protein methyltransferase [Halomarina sp. PSRA2]
MSDLRERADDEQVYQPAEDSDLLARAVAERLDGDERLLDVGTGSGYVAATVADETGCDAVGVDLSPLAVRAARERGVPVVRGDLLAPFRDGAFDVVAFNPPYLPTDPDAEWDDWMEHALSGGADGRRLVDPFLDDVRRVLAPGGRVFLLVSSLTDIEAVRERARANGLRGDVVAEASFPFERLVVLDLRPRD